MSLQVLRDGGAKVVGLDEAQAQLVISGGAELQQQFYQIFSSSELCGGAIGGLGPN